MMLLRPLLRWQHILLIAIACTGREHTGNAEPQNTVTLSLGEFEELFSSARLEEAARRSLDQKKRQEAEHQRKLADLEEERKRFQAEENAKHQREDLFPDNFQVLSQSATGIFNASSPSAGVEGDVTKFAFEMMFRIMEPRWTVVPLINTTSTVASNWAVSVQQKDEGEGKDAFVPADPVTSPDLMLMAKNEQQVLATNVSGLFRVTFDVYTRVSKTRSLNALGISNLLYPLSDFSLRIAACTDSEKDMAGSGTNIVSDLSVEPASSVLEVSRLNNVTDVTATLPLNAKSILIKWLDVVEREKPSREDKDNTTTKKKVDGAASSQVTASQEVLHTVGEGVIRSTHILDFSTTASEMAALNSVQFFVYSGENMLRVTSVEGHALQSWTAERSSKSSNETSSTTTQLVKVAFKSTNLDSSVTLHVNTEMDLSETSSELTKAELPRIDCVGVLRQTGFIAVIKEANVEVHEHEIRGLSRIDASDIPSQLRLNTDRPIVTSYRYLNPKYSVVLDVQEHETIDTLEAALDRIHYEAQVTDTHTLHSTMFIVQSTKLQYLELSELPPTASMYTVLVNSVPTKPVHGRDSTSILIPLLVGLDTEVANAGGNMKTSVEVTYISNHNATLGQNGTLELSPPQTKLPVSVHTVHLRLPGKYDYKFSGSFGDKSKGAIEYPIPPVFSYATGKRVVKKDHIFTAVDDLPVYTAAESAEQKKGGGSVKLVTPRTGRSHYFSRLIVVDDKLSLTAEYSIPPKKTKKQWWWSRLYESHLRQTKLL